MIYERSISYLKISVGSEIAMMLKPDIHWVGNKRTIWSHLLVKHGMNQRPANQELRLYYARDDDSEMDYSLWQYCTAGRAGLPVYYYLGRAREGFGSPGAAEAYASYLKIREKSTNDPLVADTQKRLRALR